MSNNRNVTISITAEQGYQGVVPINAGVDVIEVESAPGGSGSGFTLPPTNGQLVRVINNTGVSIKVWPAPGALIGGESVNTAITMQALTGRHLDFVSYKSNKWSQSDVQWR